MQGTEHTHAHAHTCTVCYLHTTAESVACRHVLKTCRVLKDVHCNASETQHGADSSATVRAEQVTASRLTVRTLKREVARPGRGRVLYLKATHKLLLSARHSHHVLNSGDVWQALLSNALQDPCLAFAL